MFVALGEIQDCSTAKPNWEEHSFEKMAKHSQRPPASGARPHSCPSWLRSTAHTQLVPRLPR